MGTGAVLAQSAAIPDGDWRGSMSYSSQPVVSVRLRQGPGARAGSQLLQFGAPLNCSLSLLPVDGGSYRVEVQNGGAYCDRLWGASAMLRWDAAGSVGVHVSGGKGDTLDLQLLAEAMAPGALAGRWSSNSDKALQLKVVDAPLRPGDLLMQLSYGAPRDCTADAHYAGLRGQTLVAAFAVNANGYCSRLSDGYATLSAHGGQVALEVFDRNGKRLDAAELTRQP
jgi:hypothetical protein